MQSARKAEIGIILMVAGVALAFVWWYLLWYLFTAWSWASQISVLAFAALTVAPSIVLTAAGLATYSTGRKDFWKSYSRREELLTFVGLAFMFVGGFFLAYICARAPQPSYARSLTYYLANNSPYFILFALWFITGLFIFADSLEAYWRRK